MKSQNLMEKEDFKKNSQNEFKNKWCEKRIYDSLFVKCLKKQTWKWFVQIDLKVQTEATISAAQQQALITNYTNRKIYCVACAVKGEKLCSI